MLRGGGASRLASTSADGFIALGLSAPRQSMVNGDGDHDTEIVGDEDNRQHDPFPEAVRNSGVSVGRAGDRPH